MEQKFYHKNWFIVFMIFCFFPLGYYLYYKYHTAKLDTKGGVFLASLIIFVIALPFNMATIILIYLPFLIYLGLLGKKKEALEKETSTSNENMNILQENVPPLNIKQEIPTDIIPTSTYNDNPIVNIDLEVSSNISDKDIPANFKPDKYWISPGNSITVNGYTIKDGMVYVGSDLKSANKYVVEAALINPSLTIYESSADYKKYQMCYWPSYYKASPEERASYLLWLSNGKQDPEANIGYVFLYFYGLERRLLCDISQDPNLNYEKNIIVKEIERLLSIYGENNSFHSYATLLLNYMQAESSVNTACYNQSAPEPTFHLEIPFLLKIGLAQMIRDGIPLPADWALCWYLSTPDPPTYSRTAAQRCYPEFKKLFEQKYKNKYNDGIKMKPNKTMISFEYHPASESLNNKIYTIKSCLPDITATKKYLKSLEPLIQSCHNDLDRYSRYLGRNPDKKNTIDALLELPVSVWPDNAMQKFKHLVIEISENPNPSSMSFSDFLNKIPSWENKTKTKMINFLNILESNFQIGMEPDCRSNGKVPNSDSTIVLFPQDYPVIAEISLEPQYIFATLVLHLMILVTQVDGKISSEEKNMLMNQINKWDWVDQKLKLRLKAHAIWMGTQCMNMNGIKRRIEGLNASQKNLISTILVQISQADGMVSVEELKLLEKIFKILDIDIKELYSKMNQSNFDPVTVSISTKQNNDFTITPPPTVISSGLQLDMNKVSALAADSEKVTSLLSEIFSSEDENNRTEQPTAKNQNSTSSVLWGLSTELSKFTYHIICKPTWTFAELEKSASDHAIMLNGALEEINDAAFDSFDEPLIEDNGDIYEINQDIVKVILK